MSDHSSTTTTTAGEPAAGEPATGEPATLAAPAPHPRHGMSVAAWVACGGIMLGTLVSALGFMWAPFSLTGGVVVAVVGGVVAVASALAGPVLVRAGYGEHSANREYTGGPRAIR